MATYEEQIRRLADLGPRTSGSAAHRAHVEDVAARLAALGYEVGRDTHTFERWDAGAVGLSVGTTEVEVASAWPYSGETGPAGVTAPLVALRGRGPRRRWRDAAGAIAVVEVDNVDVPTRLLCEPWEWGLPFATAANPVIGSELAGTDLRAAREAGVLGVVAVWRGLPDEAARGQYLPFTRGHQGLPAVWVGESQRERVLAAAARGESATLLLDATRTPGATMDTLWAVSPGTGPRADEAVLVVTHSDGGNAVEENGHVGLLALARDAATVPHERTVVLVVTAGHLRIPAVTTHGQATTAWLTAHPELWSPDGGGLTAVAGLVIEHLGARHAPGGAEPEPELLYATTPELARLARATWRGIDDAPATPVRPGALIHLGEGEPLYEHGIPAIALVTGPVYLLAERTGEQGEHGERDDLVDVDLLTRQVDSFRRLLAHLAGAPDRASFGRVRRASRAGKALALARVLAFLATRRRA